MIKEKVLEGLNEQINKEYYSAYLYLSMAAYLDTQDLPGFASWMRVQVREELGHGLIMFNYVGEQGSQATLSSIDCPPAEYKSVAEVFEKVLEHEKTVTASINALMDTAIEERDHATKQFLEWFVAEQVEEEATASNWLAQAKRVGDGNSLFLLDKEAAARAYTVPPQLAGKL